MSVSSMDYKEETSRQVEFIPACRGHVRQVEFIPMYRDHVENKHIENKLCEGICSTKIFVIRLSLV